MKASCYFIYSTRFKNHVFYVDTADRLTAACRIFGVDCPDYEQAPLSVVPHLDTIISKLRAAGANIHLATDLRIRNEMLKCRVKGCSHYVDAK